LLAAAALAAVAVACGGGGDAPAPSRAETRPCPPAIDGEPERRPPPELAILDGAHTYASEGPFGRTERFFAAIDGAPGDLVARRDAAADALVAAGFRLLSKDDEAPVEAEAHVSGERMVSVQVTSLCAGKLRLRYTVF
jgi:hypothetical protein